MCRPAPARPNSRSGRQGCTAVAAVDGSVLDDGGRRRRDRRAVGIGGGRRFTRPASNGVDVNRERSNQGSDLLGRQLRTTADAEIDRGNVRSRIAQHRRRAEITGKLTLGRNGPLHTSPVPPNTSIGRLMPGRNGSVHEPTRLPSVEPSGGTCQIWFTSPLATARYGLPLPILSSRPGIYGSVTPIHGVESPGIHGVILLGNSGEGSGSGGVQPPAAIESTCDWIDAHRSAAWDASADGLDAGSIGEFTPSDASHTSRSRGDSTPNHGLPTP